MPSSPTRFCRRSAASSSPAPWRDGRSIASTSASARGISATPSSEAAIVSLMLPSRVVPAPVLMGRLARDDHQPGDRDAAFVARRRGVDAGDGEPCLGEHPTDIVGAMAEAAVVLEAIAELAGCGAALQREGEHAAVAQRAGGGMRHRTEIAEIDERIGGDDDVIRALPR